MFNPPVSINLSYLAYLTIQTNFSQSAKFVPFVLTFLFVYEIIKESKETPLINERSDPNGSPLTLGKELDDWYPLAQSLQGAL